MRRLAIQQAQEAYLASIRPLSLPGARTDPISIPSITSGSLSQQQAADLARLRALEAARQAVKTIVPKWPDFNASIRRPAVTSAPLPVYIGDASQQQAAASDRVSTPLATHALAASGPAGLTATVPATSSASPPRQGSSAVIDLTTPDKAEPSALTDTIPRPVSTSALPASMASGSPSDGIMETDSAVQRFLAAVAPRPASAPVTSTDSAVSASVQPEGSAPRGPNGEQVERPAAPTTTTAPPSISPVVQPDGGSDAKRRRIVFDHPILKSVRLADPATGTTASTTADPAAAATSASTAMNPSSLTSQQQTAWAAHLLSHTNIANTTSMLSHSGQNSRSQSTGVPQLQPQAHSRNEGLELSPTERIREIKDGSPPFVTPFTLWPNQPTPAMAALGIAHSEAPHVAAPLQRAPSRSGGSAPLSASLPASTLRGDKHATNADMAWHKRWSGSASQGYSSVPGVHSNSMGGLPQHRTSFSGSPPLQSTSQAFFTNQMNAQHQSTFATGHPHQLRQSPEVEMRARQHSQQSDGRSMSPQNTLTTPGVQQSLRQGGIWQQQQQPSGSLRNSPPAAMYMPDMTQPTTQQQQQQSFQRPSSSQGFAGQSTQQQQLQQMQMQIQMQRQQQLQLQQQQQQQQLQLQHVAQQRQLQLQQAQSFQQSFQTQAYIETCAETAGNSRDWDVILNYARQLRAQGVSDVDLEIFHRRAQFYLVVSRRLNVAPRSLSARCVDCNVDESPLWPVRCCSSLHDCH